MNELRIFICYAHEDEAWLKEGPKNLVPFLNDRFKHDSVVFWWDSGIKGGDDWEKTILFEIERADIAIPLLSGHLVNSDYVMKTELPRIKERYNKGCLSVLPILIGSIGENARRRLEWILGLQVVPDREHSLEDKVINESEWNRLREAIVDLLEERINERRQCVDEVNPYPPSPVVSNSGTVQPVPPSGRQSSQRLRSIWSRLAAFLGLLILLSVIGYLIGDIHAHRELKTNKAAFNSAMPWIKWIVYDPSDNYDPTQGKYPPERSVTRDMETLVQWGVKGIITTSSKDVLGQVPRIAKEAGIVMVIVGVWDPSDSKEIANTLAAAPYADAYCVGNQALRRGISLKILKTTMDLVRRKTLKPVSFSERLSTYEADLSLAALGDYFFPDSAIEWLLMDDSTNTKRATNEHEAYSETIRIAKVAAEVCNDASRPILLKMIGFPSAGHEGFSEETQANFFWLVCKLADDDSNLPANVHISFMTAFDPTWKSEEINWASWEQHTGLFRSDRTPKAAAAIFRDWTITK